MYTTDTAPDSSVHRGSSVHAHRPAYLIEIRVWSPEAVFPSLGPLETIVENASAPIPGSEQPSAPSPYAHSTAPLAAYIKHDTGEAIVPRGQSTRESDEAIKLAQAYWNDVQRVENSELGRTIHEETKKYTPLEIIASGINELERSWPGAVQTTTFLPDGTGFYTRDATHYNEKLESMAVLHGVTPEVIHRFATAHEYLHGRGITDERVVHETLYRALEKAIEKTDDPSEKREYELMLHVQQRELALRYGVKRTPRAPKRVVN